MTTLPPAVRLGERKPRVCRVPDHVSSAGPEAIELAASAGLVLDPWQQDVLTAALSERKDGRWAAFEVGVVVARQNGKGSILEARELFGLFVAREQLITHTAHLFGTSLEAFRRIKLLIESTPDLDRKVKRIWETTGREGIEILPRYGGSRLRFLARSKGAGRGFSGDVVIWDEAFALTDEHVDALMPTMSAKPNPQIWYTSSPPLDAVTGVPLMRLRDRAEDDADPKLAWFDWGADIDVDPDDRETWYATNPAMGYRVTEDFVEAEHRAMSPEGFRRERLCVWPPRAADAWQVITEADWGLAVDAGTTADGEPLVLAIDVTPDRSHGAIAIVGPRADGNIHGEIVDHRPDVFWIPGRVKALVEKWKPLRVVVNPAGAAGSLLPELNYCLVPTFYEELTLMKGRDRAHAYGLFHQHVSTQKALDSDVEPTARRLKVRPSAALTLAVASASTRRIEEGTVWDRRSELIDNSTLLALTNALHGFVARPALEPVQPAYVSPPDATPSGFFRPSSRLSI